MNHYCLGCNHTYNILLERCPICDIPRRCLDYNLEDYIRVHSIEKRVYALEKRVGHGNK